MYTYIYIVTINHDLHIFPYDACHIPAIVMGSKAPAPVRMDQVKGGRWRMIEW